MAITKPLTQKRAPSAATANVVVSTDDTDEGAMIVLSEEEAEESVQDLTQDEEVEAASSSAKTAPKAVTNQDEGDTTVATMTPATPDYPYTVQDVADQASVPVSRVNALRKAGHISASNYSKDGRAFVYNTAAVEEVRAAQEAKVKLGPATMKGGTSGTGRGAGKTATGRGRASGTPASVGTPAASVTSALDSAIQAAQGEADSHRQQEALHAAEAARYEGLVGQLQEQRDGLGT